MANNDPIPHDDQAMFLREIIDSSPVLLHTARPDGYLEFFNQQWLDFVGEPLERLLGWGWTSYIHPDDVVVFLKKMRQSLAAKRPFQERLRLRRADGVYRWMLHKEVPRSDSDGNLIKWCGSSIDIDEWQTVDEQFTRRAEIREQDLFGVIETIPSMVWSLSPAGAVTYVNKRVLEYCGTTFEELANGRWFSFIHPEDREPTAAAFARSLSSGTSHRIVHRIRRADGVYRWFHTMGEPLRDRQGEVIHWFGINLDIDERKRAEEALQKSESELRTLIDAMPAFVGTARPDGSVDFVSQSFLAYTGCSREQCMDWGWGKAVHPEDLYRVLASWRAALASGAPIEHEVRFRRTDGTYQWFLFRGLPLRDGDGSIVKWYATITNIDTLKQAESALQNREQELIGIIETIPSLLWSASPSGEVTHISQRVLEYTGLSLGEFRNLGWKKIIHPDDFEDTAKAYFHAIQSGEPYSATHRLRRRDGEYRWYYASGEPLRNSEGTIIQWYGLSIDIDERKRAEDHLRDTGITLAKASRLATVAELAASIAHELNQPLTSILANAQAAKRWLSADPANVSEASSSIERIIRDAHAADEAMQHIRALFKQESYHKTSVNIPDVLREVVRVVQEDPKNWDVPIQCAFDESVPSVLVDQIQMQQVFINLIVNAMEAMEGEQRVPRIMLRVTADSNEVLVQVIDNGRGISDPERIFDAFMTTKEKGMGIGLAVSRTIVEAHGGRLGGQNGSAGGAVFNVYLPLSRATSTTDG